MSTLKSASAAGRFVEQIKTRVVDLWVGSGGRHDEAVPAESADVDHLRGEVVALLPEFGMVHVRTDKGRVLAVTAHTKGIDVGTLQRGQRLECTVTRVLPRVLDAKLLA
jgi:hypothetical protein